MYFPYGRATSPALAGTARSFILPYNRDNNTDQGRYIHNDVPINSQSSQSSSSAHNAAPVAKRAALPGTQRPVGDQQFPHWPNGQPPRPRNGLSTSVNSLRLRRALSIGFMLNNTGYPSLPPTQGIGNPRVFVPSYSSVGSTSRATTNNTGCSSPRPTREEAAKVLLSLGKERINPQCPFMDNTSITTTTNNASNSNINDTSNTAFSSPPLSRGTITLVSFLNDNVQAEYFRLGLRRGVYERCVTPPGCFPVEQSRCKAPHKGKRPNLNYLMHKYLSVVPGHRMETTPLILAIIEWAPEVIAVRGVETTKRNAQASKCRNRDVFMMEEKTYTRLRRVGEPEQNPSENPSGNPLKKPVQKRKRVNNDNHDDGSDELQSPKKKQQTKKPATTEPKKDRKGRGKATSCNSLLDMFEIRGDS